MTSMLDIGRSGLLASRTALTVTSENIANAETEGYRRRDVSQSEVLGGVASPLSQGIIGHGVEVTDIRRAFDALLAERTRSATSALGSAEILHARLVTLEEQMQPGTDGLLDRMDDFFNAVSSLSQAPEDRGLRRVVMAQGEAFANAVQDMSAGMSSLKSGVENQMDVALDGLNDLMNDLAKLQQRMLSSPDTYAQNSLKDQRDRLINRMAELTDVHASIDARGIATVRLGAYESGPVLVEGGDAGRVTLTSDTRLSVTEPGLNGAVLTRTPSGGQLDGFTQALGAISAAIADLDDWAAGMASDLNTVHASGLDANGAPGGDLFALDGWEVLATPINRGTGTATVISTDLATAPKGPLELIYNATATEWQAFENGTLLGGGATRIDLTGMSISVTGNGVDGDILQLTATHGAAANMRFVPQDPDLIAASGAVRAAAVAGNTGTGQIRAVEAAAPTSGLASLETTLTAGDTALEGVQFLNAGAVGVIPANASAAQLASLGVQSQLSFSTAASANGSATQLGFTLGGTTYSFNLTVDSAGAPVPAWTSMADLARMLNDGTVVAAGGETLAELGVHAAGAGTELTLSAARGDFGTGGSLTATGGPFAGTATPSTAAAEDLRLFTRDGRQISGPPMDAASAAAFLTAANGFLDGASYSYDPEGYRDITGRSLSPQGDYTLALTAGGTGLATWTGSTPAAAAAAQSLTLVTVPGASQIIDVPVGATAGRIAQLVNETGAAEASAATNLSLTTAADGTISFQLAGDNLSPVTISAAVTGGRMEALAAAISAASGLTGITAEASSDGARVLLSHAGGADIELTGLTHSAGSTVGLTRTDANGTALGAATTLGGGAPDAARISGQITLSSGAVFDAGFAGTATATRNAEAGGLVTNTASDAGSTRSLEFVFDADIDGSHAATDGTDGYAAATQYTANLTASNGTVLTATVDGLTDTLASPADVAAAMAAALRENAPSSQTTGRALTALPADGSSIGVMLGDQRYDITMVGGAPSVSGPEAGRVTASFDSTNRLVLSTTGGSLDGAALRIPTPQGNAFAFGIDTGSAPVRELQGQQITTADVPPGSHSFQIEVAGTAHTITLSNSGGSLTASAAAGFPGSVTYDAVDQRVEISLTSGSADVRIAPQTGAEHAGFNTASASLSVENGVLQATATDGRALALHAGASGGPATRVDLANLPAEELIVAMDRPGALNLAGGVTQPASPTLTGPIEVVVTDAASGAVDIFDANSGDLIASRVLNSAGQTNVAGFDITLSGALATGDRFAVTSNSNGQGDAATLEAMVDLRERDPSSGAGGFAEIYSTILTEVGGQVAAAEQRLTSEQAGLNSARAAEDKASGVDLDTEAANLVKQQQAFQANAQVISVARQLFDTLMNAL